jgi:F-type H+-transporting ATPase subunit epsilon
MAEKLRLEVVTPYGSVLKDEVDEVVLPGSMGELGILPGHTSFVTTLRIGMLSYKKDGVSGYVFVNSGYLEVNDDNVLVLADSAERSEDIDVERAKAAMKRAEENLKRKKAVDFAMEQAALERALARIEVAEKRR